MYKSIILIVCMLCYSSTGCEKKEQPKEVVMTEFKADTEWFNIDEDRVVLLSSKYKVSGVIVINVLKEYEARSLEILVNNATGFNPTNSKIGGYKTLIANLSNKYSVPEDILASLVVDYKMWDSCNEAASLHH